MGDKAHETGSITMRHLMVLVVISSMLSIGCAHVYTAHQDRNSMVLCCPTIKIACSHEALIEQATKQGPQYYEVETDTRETNSVSYTAYQNWGQIRQDSALCVSFRRM